MAYYFTPPYVLRAWDTGDRFWSRLQLPRYQTVLVAGGEVTTVSEYTTQDQEAAADYVYRGGSSYLISSTEYDILVAAGYADRIESR